MTGAYILHVDDDQDELMEVERVLKSAHSFIGVKHFLDGKSAFDFLESIAPGDSLPVLIILDLNMPGWSGMQTLTAIRRVAAYAGIPIVIFSNSDHPEHRRSSIELGADDFLSKPYTFSEMVKVCERFGMYLGRPVQVR